MSSRLIPSLPGRWRSDLRLLASAWALVAVALLQGSAADEIEVPRPAHWAFQPIKTDQDTRDRGLQNSPSPIDALIQDKLREHGLVAAGQADKYTLIRRACYDLTGLPPTPEEISSFLADTSPGSYARLIDRLLASDAYGERWGRYWLDLARYADTNGADENMAHPNAWRYRDYVIRAFNEDKPYDRFLTEQLAGDLLPASCDPAADLDQTIATGFLSLGPKMLAEQDKEKMLIDIVDEQIDVVSKTFMGLTVSCARCHDHKTDPVTQKDYYALGGIFRSTETMANTDHVSRWVETVLEMPGNGEIVTKYEQDLAAKKAEIAALDPESGAENHEARLAELEEQLKKLESAGAPLPKAMVVRDGEPVDMAVLVRGDHLTPVEEPTPRGLDQLLAASLPPPRVGAGTSGRLELAGWLTDPQHPLTARVMVNRIWQGHFGTGLVRTPSNFGPGGEAPSHPELLDWLAHAFIANGWSIKQMHRTIMLTETYRRSSESDPAQSIADPENRLLSRQNRRRLEAEPIRDALLFVSGQLERTGERSLGELESNTSYYRKEQASFAKKTRAVYLPVARANGYEMFSTFDAADPAVHHQKRATTIVPGQALFMLNSDVVLEAAKALAANIENGDPQTADDRLDALYLRLFGRPARPEETGLLLGAPDPETGTSAPPVAGWEQVCRVLLAANEFVYVD